MGRQRKFSFPNVDILFINNMCKGHVSGFSFDNLFSMLQVYIFGRTIAVYDTYYHFRTMPENLQTSEEVHWSKENLTHDSRRKGRPHKALGATGVQRSLIMLYTCQLRSFKVYEETVK